MTTRAMRSWMFVPGNRERFLEKAAVADVDCVFLDLEDGVLPESKQEAREMVARVLKTPFLPARYVRINAASTDWLTADLEAIVPSEPDGVCLSKCESPEEVLELAQQLSKLEVSAGATPGQTKIVAAIESPAALLIASQIAKASDRIIALMLGAEDLALDLGLGTERQGEAAELLFARSTLVYAAAAARVLSIDGVYPNLNDPVGLERDTIQARRLGFSAKSTFNPRQVDAINRIFTLRPDEIAYAKKVAAAFEEAERAGDASVAVGGQLVDRPIVLRALRTLELAEQEGML